MPKKKNQKVDENWNLGKIEKSHCRAGDYVTEGIFCLLLRQGKK